MSLIAASSYVIVNAKIDNGFLFFSRFLYIENCLTNQSDKSWPISIHCIIFTWPNAFW